MRWKEGGRGGQEVGNIYKSLKRPEWLGRSFMLSSRSHWPENVEYKRFGSLQLSSSVCVKKPFVLKSGQCEPELSIYKRIVPNQL